MAFYLDSIEQIKDKTSGELNEYGKREKKNTYEAALTAYYTALGNVSNDLITPETPDNNHYFMDLRIVDGKGGVVKRDALGARQEA